MQRVLLEKRKYPSVAEQVRQPAALVVSVRRPTALVVQAPQRVALLLVEQPYAPCSVRLRLMCL